MKLSEHLLFLALMVPTIVLIAVAVVLVVEPAHPAPLAKAAAPAVDARAR